MCMLFAGFKMTDFNFIVQKDQPAKAFRCRQTVILHHFINKRHDIVLRGLPCLKVQLFMGHISFPEDPGTRYIAWFSRSSCRNGEHILKPAVIFVKTSCDFTVSVKS